MSMNNKGILYLVSSVLFSRFPCHKLIPCSLIISMGESCVTTVEKGLTALYTMVYKKVFVTTIKKNKTKLLFKVENFFFSRSSVWKNALFIAFD